MTQQQLDALKYRRTTYETILSNGEQTRLLGYTARSRDAMIRLARIHGPELVAFTGTDAFTVGPKTLLLGDWTIRQTGRTQREAITSGELPRL